MSKFIIDGFAFSSQGKEERGKVSFSDMPRLYAEFDGHAGEVNWLLRGGKHFSGYPELFLKISTEVMLCCQRCLKPLSLPLNSNSTLILANDEHQADEIESLLELECVEVITASNELNVIDLIEDEVLLAIPSHPKHDACLIDDENIDQEVSAKISPFSILKANLKH